MTSYPDKTPKFIQITSAGAPGAIQIYGLTALGEVYQWQWQLGSERGWVRLTGTVVL